MNEKELANKIYNELKIKSKFDNFLAKIIKPEYDEDYNGYDINKLKFEAQKLGYNIFLKEEVNAKGLKNEKGETLIATFKEINDL